MDSSSMRAARPHLVRGTLAGLVAVLGLILARFGQLTDEGSGDLADEATSLEQALATAGALLLLFAGVVAVRAFSKAVRVALEERVGDARSAPLGMVVSVFGYLILLVLILSALGVPLEGLFLGGALTGVVIGIAAQQTLGNFFAGIVLLAVRPFNIGDEIVLRSGPLGGEYEGAVTDMGLFYLRMVTAEGPVQLPNAGVLAAAIGPGSRAPKQNGAPPNERESSRHPPRRAAPPAPDPSRQEIPPAGSKPSPMKRILIVLALVAAVLPAAAARAEPVPENATWEQVWFPSDDDTMLHADVFLPKERKKNERHPVILSIGPYFGSGGFLPPTPTRQGPVLRFNDLITEGRIFERGYAYVQVDSRGYGASDGCYGLGGDGEQMDAKAAVEWAAEQPWSNGRVGMWGKSYDAWTQVMALAQKPKGLEAAIIQSPLIEGYGGFFMNGVHYDEGWFLTPGLYLGYDLVPPSVNDSPPEEFLYPVKGTATNPDCYVENMTFSAVYDHDIDYWQERDIIRAAGKSRVPVLWSHGFNDANTKPDQFLRVYEKLRGPTRAWFGQYAHDRGNEVDRVGRDGFMDEAMDWLDHFLKRERLVAHPRVEVQDNNGGWRTEAQWPPRDARHYALRVKEGTYADERGNQPGGSNGGNGTWTFTQPAPHDLHFAGTPRVKVKIDSSVPNVNLIAFLYDVEPDGDAKLISRGAYLVEEPGKASFDMYPQDWRLPKGHRIGLLLSGSDESWFSPVSTGTDVTVASGTVSLPFLRFLRTNNLEGGPAQAQSSVPSLDVEPDVIAERQVRVRFPPPLRRR